VQVRTLTGHSGDVTRVAFSHDGASNGSNVVVSASDDDSVRLWDVTSGRQVRQLAGTTFALVEGLSCEHKKGCHVITALGRTLRIYECAEEQQHAVACFKAPDGIASVQCVGATICVGCGDGAICILSAPFLAA